MVIQAFYIASKALLSISEVGKLTTSLVIETPRSTK